MFKVLIMEDEEIIRKGLTYSIDWLSMGCVVVGSAADGKSGLKMILKEKPDIVITDIRMPGMSGIEMLQQASSVSEFCSSIITSFADFEYARSAIDLGVFQYLLKPLDEEELRRSIQKLTHRIKEKRRYTEVDEILSETSLPDMQKWKLLVKAEKTMDPYVRKTYDFINANYRKHISINQAADLIGVSSSYLSRRLKQNLGTGFVDILNQFRIRKAIHLLSEREIKIYEISDYLGFTDYKYFCTVFKKYLGYTPSEYQKNISVMRKE